MKKIVFAMILSLLLCNSAQACYTAREREAEQGIRIHSELMVISLTCMKMPGGEDLYDKYQHFTRKNGDLISEYESVLIGYYKSEGATNPEKKLTTLRTEIANNISGRAITMSTRTFCEKYASHIDRALTMDEQKLRRWAQNTWPEQQPISERMCSGN